MADDHTDVEDNPVEPSPVVHPLVAAEGLILSSQDATPLEFWVGVRSGSQLELDDLVVVETLSPRQQTVRFFGIVDVVRKRYEGAQYDSDAFRAAAGTLPADVSYAAHVQVTCRSRDLHPAASRRPGPRGVWRRVRTGALFRPDGRCPTPAVDRKASAPIYGRGGNSPATGCCALPSAKPTPIAASSPLSSSASRVCWSGRQKASQQTTRRSN